MMVGVVLAAGASSRMGSPKPLKRDRGESFLAHGIRGLWTACDSVVVVLGSSAPRVRAGVEAEFERLALSGRLHREVTRAGRARGADLEARFVVHRGWQRGMFSSVRAGLKAALAAKPDGVLILPVDHPGVRPRTIDDLAAVMRLALAACPSDVERKRFSYALAPRFRRRRGHPLALTPALARAITLDVGAETLSEAVRRNARLIGYLDVPDPAVVRNRNRPGD